MKKAALDSGKSSYWQTVGWTGLFSGVLILSFYSVLAGIVGLTLIVALRYVSVGSIISSVSGGVALIVLSINGSEPLVYSWYGAIGPLLILFRHRDNIGRLSRGEEHKLGKPFEKYSKEKKTDPVRGVGDAKTLQLFFVLLCLWLAFPIPLLLLLL